MIFRSMMIAVLLLPLCGTPDAGARTVSLPIAIEYPMLTSLVSATAFSQPGEQAQVVDEDGGCRRVTLSEPRFGQEDGRIRFSTRVAVHAGVSIGSRCLTPVQWEGYLVMVQRPRVDPLTWRLSFDIESSHLETLAHEPARVAEVVWDLIKNRVYAYLESLAVDLSLPLDEVKYFVRTLFDSEELTQRAERLIDGMRPGDVSVDPKALTVPILADVEVGGQAPPGAGEPVAPGDGAAAAGLMQTWETWDEFLVSMITSLTYKPLTDGQRQLLLSVLLDMRYRFSEEMAAPAGGDLVRRQFVDAWTQLAPIFRAHLQSGSARTLLGYLAFFSASDALAALDAVGPELGIEVSRSGLVRLIQFLAEGPAVALIYRPDVNPLLRQTLGLDGPGFIPWKSDARGDDGSLRADGFRHLAQAIRHGLFAEALAADAQTPPVDTDELKPWVPSLAGVDNYRIRVRALLSDAARAALEQSPLSEHFQGLCLKIVPAVAWQESCMRQFTEDQGQVTSLRSYNGSSVGIMQINERVWRGIYDLKRLRWEIRYNAKAGAEILVLYFYRFLLPEAARSTPDLVLDEKLLARLIYAMYNGGPGEFGRFQKRQAKGRLYLSDRLFYQKYEWIEAGRWQLLDQCFGG